MDASATQKIFWFLALIQATSASARLRAAEHKPENGLYGELRIFHLVERLSDQSRNINTPPPPILRVSGRERKPALPQSIHLSMGLLCRGKF